MRVGRAALDEEAIRLIEEHHPQIHFNWPQILNGEEEPAPPEPSRRAEPANPPDPIPVPTAEVSSIPTSQPSSDEPLSPAHARLGSEGLARLRARFADVSATISRRVQDEQRRQQLLELADRLNPDSWVTGEEVQRGLDEYEKVLASLREVVGRRRRRKRSRSGPGPSAGNPAGEAVPTAAEGRPEDDESEDSESA